MLSRDENFELNGNQILENLAHMADRQRIMSFVLNESRFAIRETVRDSSRQPNGESAIFYSMQDREFRFRAGEKILTEHSYKHAPEGFIALARQAGFDFVKLWTDDARLFGVFYFVTASE